MAENPLDTVGAWPGITLALADESRIAGSCSVSGAYFYDERRIVVSKSASPRRQYFTALHELAHDLQEHDDEFVTLLEEEPEAGIALEDDICDAFAAEVLISRSIVDQIIGPKGPTADNVVELFDLSQASREACCVRAAQKILGEGYVMLCGLDGVAKFTATTTPYRVRRMTAQAGNEVVEAAVRWGRARRESRVRFASGAQSPRYFGHAVADAGFIFAVYVDHSPAWVTGLTPTLEQPNYPIGANLGD